MAVTTAQTIDVARVLAEALGDVDGLRVEWYPADKARPPVALVALAEIDYQDPEAGFCHATYTFPVTIVTARNNDRDTVTELYRLVGEVALALEHADGTGVFDISPLDARPTTVTINGQELPAYTVRVQVHA